MTKKKSIIRSAVLAPLAMLLAFGLTAQRAEAMTVEVSTKWGGTTGGTFVTSPLGGSPGFDDTWVCVLTGVWGQLAEGDSIGVAYNSVINQWELYADTYTSNTTGVYVSAACTNSLSSGPFEHDDMSPGDLAQPWGYYDMCGLSGLENVNQLFWNASSSFASVQENSAGTFWAYAQSNVTDTDAYCATLNSTGHLWGFTAANGSTTYTPNNGNGGALCGLTRVQGNFASNTNPNAGVFLTPNFGTNGVWKLTASTGFSGQADCWW